MRELIRRSFTPNGLENKPMAIGTSDGSDFGGAGHGDGPTQYRFQRFDSYHPERNIHISVFPHGRNGGLKQQIDKTARQSGLVPQHVWDSPGKEKFAHHILSADPWKEDYSKMPQGFYAGATGNTTYGAVCWKIPKKRGGQLEISYVTWYFYEAADFSTSIVAKIVPPSYATLQEFAEFTNVATKIARKLTDWLESAPPPPAAIILRQSLTGQEFGQNIESETPAITDLKLPKPDGETISSELSTLEIELGLAEKVHSRLNWQYDRQLSHRLNRIHRDVHKRIDSLNADCES